jgi:hypothetical protein
MDEPGRDAGGVPDVETRGGIGEPAMEADCSRGAAVKTCSRCGRVIKGETIHYVPPLYLVRMGLDAEKAFHPVCYQEDEAARLLKVNESTERRVRP